MGMMAGALLQGLGAGIGTLGNASMQHAVEQTKAAQRRQERAEDFEREKMMMLERIRASEESQARMRESQAAFDDKRAPVLRQQAAENAKAGASVSDEIELGRLNPANPLAQARQTEEQRKAETARANRVADVQAMTPAEAARAGAITSATESAQTEALRARLPLEIQRAVAVADAQGRTAAKYREHKPTVADRMAETEKALGRALTEQEKMGVLGLLKSTGETDVVTTEKTVTDPKTGDVTKTTEKSTRRPGGQGGKEDGAPYPDGTELRGKDGKVYVVKDGQPVLKEAPAKPAPAKSMMTPQPGPPDSPEATALDAARMDMKAAQAVLQKYGSAQKQRDPAGYAAAQQAVASAKEALLKAEAEYQRTAGGMAPAIRFPSP